MPSRRKHLAGALCILLPPVSVQSAPQARSISGVVETKDGKPVARVEVRVTNAGGTVSSDSGEFAIPLPSQFEPGDPIIFRVRNWVVIDPFVGTSGKTYIPKSSAESVKIVVARKGDPGLLSNQQLVQQIVQGVTSQISPKPTSAPESDQFLADQASELGFTVEQLKSAITEWSKNVQGPYQKGLAALYAHQYPEASTYLQQSISSSENDLVSKYNSLAAAEYGQGHYPAAESALRKAGAVHSDDPLILNDLGVVLDAEAKGPSRNNLIMRDDFLWVNRVVPVAMKLIAAQIDFCYLLVGHLDTGRVDAGVQLRMDFQPGFGGGAGDEVHDHLVTDQRFAAPVLTDKGKQSVLDFIPFAGPRRKVTDGNAQSGFVRQFLQLQFPQPHPRAIAPSGVGRDQQASRLRIGGLPHRAPPAPDALHREGGGVVIHAHIHPSGVAGPVVNPVRRRSPQLRDEEIMHPHLLGVALGAQFPPTVLEVPDQFSFLGVHRNHRLLGRQIALHLAVEVLELGVAIRMAGSFLGLAIGLQTVPDLMQQLGHHAVTGAVPLPPQFLSQLAYALTSPAQRRFRVASGGRLHQPLQIAAQARILRHRLLAPTTRTPHPARRVDGRLLQFGRTAPDDLPRKARGSSYRRDASSPNGQTLRRRDQAPRSFIQSDSQSCEPLLNSGCVIHRSQNTSSRPKWKRYFMTGP